MEKGNEYNHKLPNITELKRIYFEDMKSACDIAEMFNVTTGAVLIKFRRYGIIRRTRSESQAVIANYVNITKEFVDFLNGLLLGDGSLVYTSRKTSCWYGHSDKNKSYLEWLTKQFNSFGIKCSEIKPHTNNTWCMKTMSYRSFVDIRKKWYPEGKKVIPELIIKPITLFNLYIGDGCFDKKSKSKKVVICSEFDQIGKIVLSDQLKEIGINNSVYKNLLYITTGSRDIFFNYIKSHSYSIPECYKYKF